LRYVCHIVEFSVSCRGNSESGRGYRFSKSPSEREAMLARRKEAVLDQARKSVERFVYLLNLLFKSYRTAEKTVWTIE